MKKINIPTISEEKILKILQKRDYEDLDLIADLEKNILRRRNYIISPLKKGENVILLLSGGLDSVVVWGLLLQHFQVHVYPFYLSTTYKLGEELSIKFYQRHFSHLPHYHSPHRLKLRGDLHFNHQLNTIQPELAVKYFAPQIGEVLQPISGANFLSVLYAGYYRMQLWWNQGLKINKIISGVTARDGIEIMTQTQTFSRQLLLTLMLTLADDEIEYFSFGLEKELGYYFSKSALIGLAQQLSLPLHKTHSCYRSQLFHCGNCADCRYRQLLFKRAHVSDQTFYWVRAYQRAVTQLSLLTSRSKKRILKLRQLFFSFRPKKGSE